jgi:hypothetical protein
VITSAGQALEDIRPVHPAAAVRLPGQEVRIRAPASGSWLI